MGRAIVRSPQVFLMDEPLSNLDAKLRVQTRSQIAALQRRLGVTTVYVTHDQVEAMTMGDRVAVLKDGILQQVDAPRRMYDHPDNVFVAGFIGSPAMNLITCARQDPVRVGGTAIDLSLDVASRLMAFGGEQVVVGFRPEAVRVGQGPLAAHIRTVEDLGSEVFVHVAIEHEGATVPVVSKMPAPFHGVTGDPIDVQLSGTVHLFDPDGGRLAKATAKFAQ